MLHLHSLFVEKNYIAFLMLKTLLFGEFMCGFKVTHKPDIIVDRAEASVQCFSEPM